VNVVPPRNDKLPERSNSPELKGETKRQVEFHDLCVHRSPAGGEGIEGWGKVVVE